MLALGRLHRNKAFDVLIRALPRLPAVHALIAGEGPERDGARSAGPAARASPAALHLPGWRQDTAGLLAGCDVLACPSRHEPLGNVVVEAFSRRASGGRRRRRTARAELIAPGADGLLVPVEDAPALGLAIASVLEDRALAVRLAASGRARYEAEFAAAPVLARWRDFLRTVETP